MKKTNATDCQIECVHAVALALLGISMTAIALAANRLGITGQPRFGPMQLMLAIVGVVTAFIPLGLYLSDKPALQLFEKNERAALLSLLILAALMNGFLMVRNPNMGEDALKYHSAFHNLMAGKGWRIYDGSWAWIDPGYGMLSYVFFLIIRDIELSGMLVSAISYLLIIPTTYYTVRFLFGKRCAFLSSFLVAFWPTLISYSYVNLTDCTFSFFLLLSFSLYTRIVLGRSTLPKSISLGVVLGLAYLIRAGEGFLVAVLALLSLFILPIGNHIKRKDRSLTSLLKPLLHPAVALLVFLILALPYIVLIHADTGYWIFTGRIKLVVEAGQVSDDISVTHQTLYRRIVTYYASYFANIVKNMEPLLRGLGRVNFHALVPLAVLWAAFPFLSTGKLFTKLRLDLRNVRLALPFIIFSSPVLIHLMISALYNRWLMQYSVYILIILAFLITRFLERLLESVGIKHFGLWMILVCLISLVTSWGRGWPSLHEALTTRHGHLGLRAAGFWLKDHIQNIDDLTIIAPVKGSVALFYANGKTVPRGKSTSIPPDMTLEEVAALVSTDEVDYLLLENFYIHTRPQLMPLWNNPSLAPEYGLSLVHSDGLFQLYTSDGQH